MPTKLIGRLAPLLSGVEQDSIHIQERHSEGTRATGTGLASRLRLWEGAPVARQPDATPTYRGSLEPSFGERCEGPPEATVAFAAVSQSGLASEVCASGEKFAAHLSHGNSGTRMHVSYCAVCSVH